MDIVGPNPKNWDLHKEDGLVLSGNKYWLMGAHPRTDNFFFVTGIKAVGSRRGQSSVLIEFDDWLDSNKYFASVIGVTFLLYAIQDGNIVRTEDGYLYGLWTFRKMGSTVSIWPCYWGGFNKDLPKEYKI